MCPSKKRTSRSFLLGVGYVDEQAKFRQKIGTNLKKMRQAAKLTQREAAIKLDTTERSLSAWETGSVNMDLWDAARIAIAYGFPPAAVFDSKLAASSKSASS